jgi:predicted transcriptional regulator
VETDPLAVALNERDREAIAALHAYLKPGDDDIEAGRVIDHEAFMREMKERYRSPDAA